MLETIAGELPDELAAVAEDTGGRLWLGFSQETAEALLELRGARLDKRALRCATRLQVGQAPAPATLALVDSVGESRFTLDVNWDPDTIPAFLALPACEAHGRSLPIDPYLVEPLEHYLRDARRRGRGQRRRRARAAAGRARRGDRARPPLARARRRALATEGALGGRAAPVPARRRRLRAASAAHVPRRRAGPRQDRPGAGRARGGRRVPGGRRLPGEPQAQLAARGRGTGCRTAAPPSSRAPARSRPPPT